jgi:hypothetical protein
MITVTLPYVYDFPVLADYMKAVKPVRDAWDFLFAKAEWKSPADQWKWCWAQDYAKDCA